MDPEQEALLNFCQILLSRIDLNKKFKKTDKAKLLQLLRPEMSDKVMTGYKKNNKTWKEDSLLHHFDELLFSMFLTGLKIHSGRLEPVEDPNFVDKFDYRYMDHMLKNQIGKIKELQLEIDELRKDSITNDEHYREMREKDEIIRTMKQTDNRLEQKLFEQRKFFEEKISYAEKESEKRVENYKQLYEDLLEKNSS